MTDHRTDWPKIAADVLAFAVALAAWLSLENAFEASGWIIVAVVWFLMRGLFLAVISLIFR